MKKQLQFLAAGILFPVLMNAQWTSQATGFLTPGRGLWDISIPDANTVWGIAFDGNLGMPAGSVPEFTKTVNGGSSFIPATFLSGYSWANISAVDANTAWVAVADSAASYAGAIFKTVDGGVSWNQQGSSLFNTMEVDFVYFWNANEGVTVGDPYSPEFQIYTTADGGANWIPVPGSSIPDPLAFEYGIFRNYCTLGNDIWFSTNKARIFHSADKGLTWSVSSTGIPMPSIYDYIDFVFWNTNEGIARKYNYTTGLNTDVRRTNDGGATWTPVTVSGTFYGNGNVGIAYVPGTTSTLVSTGTTGIFATFQVGSSYSNDGGSTWATIDSFVQHYVTRFIDNTTGWSASYNTSNVADGIFKYSGLPLGIQNPETGKELFFNVYPNPSEGMLTLHLTNAGNEDLEISIFDLFGKKVFETDFRNPGEFFMRTINLQNLSAGIYMMEASVSNISITKKIVIEHD